MTDALSSAADFVAERWTASAETDPTLVTGIAVVVVVLAAVPRIWRFVRQASTIIHEMGHVFAALLSGRRVSGIRLHSDTSGVTVSRGKPHGPGLLFTLLAGYPAPGLLALGLVGLAVSGHAGAALTVYQAVLVLALLFSRNAVGILSCLLSLAATGAVWWWNDAEVVTYTVVGLAVFYAIAGFRGTLDLCGVHLSGRAKHQTVATDASQAATAWRGLPLPAALWLMLFFMISAASAAAVFWLLYGAATR